MLVWKMVNIKDIDLYLVLGVALDATEKELVKAYRKKALKCHPDKNPDNPKAAEEFHELTKALEVLTDAAARAAYDKTLKAKKAAELRHRELDSKRKKFKEDLEARENAAQDYRGEQAKFARNLQDEVERLRREGSRLVEDEQARLAEELRKEQETNTAEADDEQTGPAPRLKVRWKAKKSDPDNGGYSEDLLLTAFSKYGEVTVLLLSSKKNGSAIVEFSTEYAAELAVQHEIGLPDNPLTLTWLSGQPTEKVSAGHKSTVPESAANVKADLEADMGGAGGGDFESLVLRRLRQAEERKKLIDQIQEEDGDS